MVFGRLARAQKPRLEIARVPESMRVYAIGDIHGRADLLRAMHRAILQDVADAAAERRVVVYLGDYIDRGPNSRETVDLLIEQPLPGFDAVHLLGNHEAFLLRFLEERTVAALWLRNGGHATCFSYGVDPAAPPEGADYLDWLQGSLDGLVPEAHRKFFAALRLSHVEGDYLFVHAGIRPGVPVDGQDPDDLLWIREPFLSSGRDFGKIVVHGHTPTDQPEQRANRIGIDTGAVYGGKLTALVLEGDGRRFLQV